MIKVTIYDPGSNGYLIKDTGEVTVEEFTLEAIMEQIGHRWEFDPGRLYVAIAEGGDWQQSALAFRVETDPRAVPVE